MNYKEIKPVNFKGDQPWIFTVRIDAKAEAPVFWSSDGIRWLIGKVPNAGKDWGQKMVSENEVAGWHHQCNENELGQILGHSVGQELRACYSQWGCKESGTTGWLRNSNKSLTFVLMNNQNQSGGHTNSMDWEAECIIRLCSNGSTLVSNVTSLEKVGLGNLVPCFNLFFCWENSDLLRHQRGDDIAIKVHILSVHPVCNFWDLCTYNYLCFNWSPDCKI